MANPNSASVAAITAAAQKYGIDPAAMIAVARVESGLNPKAVGDNGHAFGLFQFNNAGGVATGDPHPERYLNPSYNALAAARHIATIKGIKGATGADAVKLIVSGFERPANQAAEIAKATAYLGQGAGITQPTVGNINPNPSQTAPNGSLSNSDTGGQPDKNTALERLLQYTMSGSAPSHDSGDAGTSGNIMDLLTAPQDSMPAPTVATSGNSFNVSLAAKDAPAATTQAVGPHAATIVAEAQKYMGTPYKYGGADPKTGFDCSGFVQYLYKQQGINLPRTTYQQVKAGTAVAKKDLQPGDIVFFNTEGTNSHEGLYIGQGQFIQAPHTGDKVKISSLSDPYYSKRFSTARRVS